MGKARGGRGPRRRSEPVRSQAGGDSVPALPATRPGRRAVVLGASLAAVVAAGCAAGPGSATHARAADCTTPGVSGDTIKVGLIYPDTGSLTEAFKSARSAVEGRIGLANANGGVDGRQIQLEWRDDAGTSSVNASAAEDLVENQGVLGLIELSTAVSGSAGYLDQHGIPVTGLTAESLWNDHANMFSFSYLFVSGSLVSTFGEYAKAQGGTKAAVLQDGAGASAGIADQLVASLASQGITTVKRVGYTTGQSSAARAADEILASKADVIVGTVAMSSIAETLAAVRARGGNPKVVLSPTGYDPQLVRQQGPSIAGLTIWLNYTPFEAKSPAIANYESAMAQFAPELAEPDQEVAVASYISTDLFVRGLEAAGPCPTRAAFIKNLRAVRDYDAGGLVPGAIDLSDNRGRANTCYAFVRVNAAATGFDVIKKPDGSAQWCGQRLVPGTASASGGAG
ncbi:hypothetical protein FraEuI1c_3858 [Pseudofrankia inefficax]|uniref:Leucine-binding protein domain-containing protein n=1 Tax=Pseudofrankia inefficax (strain DSM 45817 / CECT 9037 / DDB 130130 / EuI1c) TaxID=298654 RepID=E3J486_PSEI1|nr:hypothetical protein FraEuI1c_3858 [Pseudofrankia inefficax]